MILLIDNYDSFSYNLYQLIGEINSDIKVIRNDEMTVDEIKALAPEYIILSPGPKRPENAGVCIDVAKELGDESKILGVCLGHQSICTAYGATVTYAKQLMHGKQSVCKIDNTDTLFKDDGEIMAVKHKEKNIWGVQFHPESIMTPDGRAIIKNFLGGSTND